jgi:hypothetical protein
MSDLLIPCIFGTFDIISISKLELGASAAAPLKQLPAIVDLLFAHHAKKERRCLTNPSGYKKILIFWRSCRITLSRGPQIEQHGVIG